MAGAYESNFPERGETEDSGEPTLVTILEYTESQLESLAKAVAVLTDKLRPILRDESDDVDPKGSVPAPRNPNHSPMALSLEERNGDINRMIREVNRLTSRVHL